MTQEPYRDSTSPPQERDEQFPPDPGGNPGPWTILVCTRCNDVFEDEQGCCCGVVDGHPEAIEVVPGSEAEVLAEALQWAVEWIDQSDEAPVTGDPGDERAKLESARDAVTEYRARHPKETP